VWLAHGREVSVILREFPPLFPLGFSALVVLVSVLALSFLIRGESSPLLFLDGMLALPCSISGGGGDFTRTFFLVSPVLGGFGRFGLVHGEWEPISSGLGRACGFRVDPFHSVLGDSSERSRWRSLPALVADVRRSSSPSPCCEDWQGRER